MLSADAYVIYANEERAMVAIILHDIGMCREGSSIVVVDYACVGLIIHRVADVICLLDCYAIYYLC